MEISNSLLNHSWVTLEFHVICLILIWLPILAIPGYGIYYLSQSTGTFFNRLRRTCRPTEWYPVKMEYRQKYEEAIETLEMTHHLTDVLN